MPAHIITMANQKGGVGKTATTHNLGSSLALAGRRVLLVDLDPQASLTISLGVNPMQLDRTIYHALTEQKNLPCLKLNSFHFVPSNIDLAAAEVELATEIGREQILRGLLEPLADEYDYILIDTPPSLGFLTVNALSASDLVLIPVSCNFLAVKGLAFLERTIKKVQEKVNPGLQILGVLPTMYDARLIHAQEILELIKERGYKVFPPIARSVRFEEAPAGGLSIAEYSKDHAGAKAYQALAEEVTAYV